jgi:hypothetical protein
MTLSGILIWVQIDRYKEKNKYELEYYPDSFPACNKTDTELFTEFLNENYSGKNILTGDFRYSFIITKEGKLIAIHPHDDPNAPEYNGEPDYYCEDENGEVFPYLYCRIRKDSIIVNDLQKEIDRLQSILDAEINANRDMSLREYELAKIVGRCGGWQTEDGHWVQGFDTVEYSGGDHAITVRSTADRVPNSQMHLYSKTIICPKCGSIMWTTNCFTMLQEKNQ